MKKFEIGKLYVIDDIGVNDAFYDNREKIIGTMVKIIDIQNNIIEVMSAEQLQKEESVFKSCIFMNTIKMHEYLDTIDNKILQLFFNLGYS